MKTLKDFKKSAMMREGVVSLLQECNEHETIIKSNIKIMINSIVKRFLKGIVAGAVASMSMVTITQPSIWSDFGTLFNSLGLACAFGGLTGLLLALQKWTSWKK